MGIRGPKPKPAAKKRADGNPGKRPLKQEPVATPGEPEMPAHLDAVARETWEWLCVTLRKMDLLFRSDVAVMTLYCDTWSEYLEARRSVQKYGSVIASKSKTKSRQEDGVVVESTTAGQPYMSPYVSLESMLKKQLMQCLAELGLSPTSRARLHVERIGDADPLAEFGICG
jgi:P27 family predicted phage terminase small subunit